MVSYDQIIVTLGLGIVGLAFGNHTPFPISGTFDAKLENTPQTVKNDTKTRKRFYSVKRLNVLAVKREFKSF